jgi:OmcA/MtrC family decaheme c-type cytochrome
MFKKGLLTLVCLTVMSALWAWAATTYSISTKITSLGTTLKAGTTNVYEPIIGGDVKVRDGVAQSTGIKYSNFTTSAVIDVVVTPKAGYKISALTGTGTGVVNVPAVGANQTDALTVTVQKPTLTATGTAAYVVATFAPAGSTATASKNWQLQVLNNTLGGAIKIQRASTADINYTVVGKSLLKSYIDTTPVTVTVTPAAGYNVDYVIVDGVKTFYKNDTVQVVNVDASTGSRLKSVVAGFQKKALRTTTHAAALVTKDPVTGGIRYADNGILPANPAVDPSGAVRLVVTPTGSNNRVTNFAVTSGSYAKISYFDRFGLPIAALPPVGPVKVTITGITSDITVAATYGSDAAKSGQYAGCTQTCHADPALVAAQPEIKAADTQWLASAHRNNNVDCVSCHKSMPGPDYSTAAAKDALCATCHIAGSTPSTAHTAAQNTCSACHTFTGGHNPVRVAVAGTVAAMHQGGECATCHSATGLAAKHNAGTPLVRGQYVAQNVTCANCHAGNNAAIMAEYAESGHGNVNADPWVHYDWAAGGSYLACQRCHTTTGYLNNLNGVAAGTGLTGGKPAQVLTCAACHVDTATGELRNPGAYTLTTGNNAQTVAFASEGASNLCIRCHAGRETGKSIAADPSATGVRGFMNSHYLTAAGTIYNKSGYEFAGQTYSDLGFHKNVGRGTAGTGNNGACVACHMSQGEGHSWEFLSHDASGNITANNSTTCVKCHANLTVAQLTAAKNEVNAALEVLKTALAAKGIYFANANPYFFTAPYVTGGTNTSFTNWAGVYGYASWKNVMGAAFNYNLIAHEPGAYAHNRQYAMKLITDSIDFMNNGIIDGDAGVTVSAAHINVATADSSSCNGCHNGVTTLATPHAGAFSTDCVSCHNNAGTVVKPAAQKSVTAAHAVTGQVLVSNVNASVVGSDVVVTYNVKLDGVDADNFLSGIGGYYHTAPATPSASPRTAAATTTQPAYTYAVKNDLVRTSLVPAIVSNGNGNYTATFVGAPTTGAANFLINVYNAAAAPRQEATVLAKLNGGSRNVVSGASCVKCHGNNVFKSGSHHGANPQGGDACVVCHTRYDSTSRGFGGDRYASYVHGIHNSKNMPNGGFDRQFPVKDGVIDFEIGYPTYMNNCNVCHETQAQLTAATSAPMSYSLCLSCHDQWKGFDHTGTTVFGGQEHSGFDWNTDCSSCHGAKTVNDFHNGLLTERAGLIYGGQDVSVTEGAKVDMQISSVTRNASSLVVVWTATYGGTAVNPCNTTVADNQPLFINGVANATTGQAAANLSLLRGYVLGDDWGNPGIGTSPGQPNSTNLTAANTVCANNIATTTLTLTGNEVTATGKAIVAIQGKAQVQLPYTFDDPLTVAAEAKNVIMVRSKTPTKEYNIDNSPVTATRRPIVDTQNCLGCHTGSLYQHGGNRIDNVDLCVMCHNEASSEQSVRIFDGVDANEAFDGKVGQTYGFKSLLHAVHSAGHNDAITMVYRTNGNYVWAKDPSMIPNYPQFDVYGDGNNGKISSVTPDDDATKTAPVGTGAAALMFGSSAPHGTGPYTETVNGTPYYQVYRAANLHVTEFPQALNNCASCHKANTFGFPDPAKAIATVVNVGGVLTNQLASTGAVYGTISDDTVQGASAAACMSCHATANTDAAKGKTKAWYANHAIGGGFAPVVRTSAGAENCASCHK